MVGGDQSDLLPALAGWLGRQPGVKAVVLFGSRVRPAGAPAAADGWSDIDLQVVTSDPEAIVAADWAALFPGQTLIFKVLRPASSGMRKLTLLYAAGEADLVLVPAWQMRVARTALGLGLHGRIGPVRHALNNLRTIMGGGHRLLHGAADWGAFYARVVAELPGFRLADEEVRQLADVSILDLLWVLQKLERGELVAAQRILHRSLVETNVVLLHEARTRRGEPTFQQARRVEQLVPAAKLGTVQASARLDRAELNRAAWENLAGLRVLMAELVPTWRVPPAMEAQLASYGADGKR
ncbi:MAG: nucleotidyltransferase domain-containing protein [Verrucomicrobia bacterium]|nr:nucleotidyltransferase domain-containing protein [Verrucomicrobiota bacterium]